MKLSLGTRLLLVTTVAVVLAVGSAVAVTYVLGNQIARSEAEKALTRAGSVQSTLQAERFEQLALIADLFVSDPYLVAYIVEAAADPTLLGSIDDLLLERQDEFGYDFGIVLDVEGRVLARTDEPDSVGRDLSHRAIVRQALEEYDGFGIWEEEGALFNAVAWPLVSTEERILEGFFVAGFAIDDLTAIEIRRVSDAEMAFLADVEAPVLVSTTLEPTPADALVRELRGQWATWERATRDAERAEHLEVELDGQRWLAVIRGLADAEGTVVGAAVSLASLDRELAPFRRLGNLLLVVGAIAVVLASILAAFVSARVMRPVRDLADAAEAASQGQYDQRVTVGRTDEVGQLATAFDHLLSELREKADMESYLARLSRTVPTEAVPTGSTEPPDERQAVLLLVDQRGFAFSTDATVEETAANVRSEADRLERAIVHRGGRVEGLAGHRLLGSFDGERAAARALGAAAEMLSTSRSQPPVVALTPGKVTAGAFGDDRRGRWIVGPAVMQADALIREGTPGDLILSPSAYELLESDLEEVDITLSKQRGLLSNRPIYVLDPRNAARFVDATEQTALLGEDGTIAPARPAVAASPGREIPPGTLLGDRFEVVSELGAGGMGVVYKVVDRELDDLVALKMLRRELWDDEGLLERLKSELRLARKITHPNVLRTFDFGEVDGRPFITMEYVRGVTLRSLLEQGTLPYAAALRLARQLCRGLAVAHEAGVLHRDIKPENLLVQPNGNAKLMDFGIARPIEHHDGQTEAGMVVGTPHYLAPEQLRGEGADERSDLYACGVVLYELFTGRLPFAGATAAQAMSATLTEMPGSPKAVRPEMSDLLEATILKCLAKRPDERYRSSQDLLADLDRLRA